MEQRTYNLDDIVNIANAIRIVKNELGADTSSEKYKVRDMDSNILSILDLVDNSGVSVDGIEIKEFVSPTDAQCVITSSKTQPLIIEHNVENPKGFIFWMDDYGESAIGENIGIVFSVCTSFFCGTAIVADATGKIVQNFKIQLSGTVPSVMKDGTAINYVGIDNDKLWISGGSTQYSVKTGWKYNYIVF